jgi:nicotinamide-nucleotide amidase
MQHLGEYIYAHSSTSLEERVVQLLRAQGVTLALAEVGSGGHLTAALMRSPEVSEVLRGSYVAPTTERLRALLGVQDKLWQGLSSNQKVGHLAQAAAQATGSLWTLAIGPSQPGENAGRYVDVVFSQTQERVKHQRLPLYGRGEAAHARLTTQLLDQLRRQLKQPPPPDSSRSNVTHYGGAYWPYWLCLWLAVVSILVQVGMWSRRVPKMPKVL